MSRHKMVKNMNLDRELDDFDGGDENDVEEEGKLLSSSEDGRTDTSLELSVEDKGSQIF